MSDPIQRSHELAAQVVEFLDEHWHDPGSASDEEGATLRTSAFRFAREVHTSDPLVLRAREIAIAVLESLSPLPTADSFAKLKQASRAYQDLATPLRMHGS
jgi:hypothetical protein